MFDHDYTLVAHPRLRAELSYRSDDGDLAAATVRLDYRRDELWTDDGTAVSLPEETEVSGVEWQGLSISLYRDGERVLAREFSNSLVSNAADAVDAAETVAPALVRRGRDAAKRITSKRSGGRVEMTQLDGSTVEALAPPAQATFEVYEGKDGKWRWRLVHDNGNVVADSGQGYSSKRSAEKGLRSVKRNALGAPVEAVGGETERDVRSGADAESGPDSGTESEPGSDADSGSGGDAESAES
ncbi:HVO_2922 family protein [Halorussus aquaticus]|uniref:HVO_2922 family protein n=1 Tax=Halorussus aquaticus TaxID=2953748 RepID=A0ABD5Q175_9EURY|nr:HVO_2922 family protein [Halorussus aquaticus]